MCRETHSRLWTEQLYSNSTHARQPKTTNHNNSLFFFFTWSKTWHSKASSCPWPWALTDFSVKRSRQKIDKMFWYTSSVYTAEYRSSQIITTVRNMQFLAVSIQRRSILSGTVAHVDDKKFITLVKWRETYSIFLIKGWESHCQSIYIENDWRTTQENFWEMWWGAACGLRDGVGCIIWVKRRGGVQHAV